MNKNFNLVAHPLIKRDITILREVSTTPEVFREVVKRISIILAVEMSKDFKISGIKIETPLERTDGYKLYQSIVLVPVLRAGLGMVNGFLEVIPEAKV